MLSAHPSAPHLRPAPALLLPPRAAPSPPLRTHPAQHPPHAAPALRPRTVPHLARAAPYLPRTHPAQPPARPWHVYISGLAAWLESRSFGARGGGALCGGALLAEVARRAAGAEQARLHCFSAHYFTRTCYLVITPGAAALLLGALS